jgi:hypothetical protein
MEKALKNKKHFSTFFPQASKAWAVYHSSTGSTTNFLYIFFKPLIQKRSCSAYGKALKNKKHFPTLSHRLRIGRLVN